MYAVYYHPRCFKFKQKYQQYGPCFQTTFAFLMAMIAFLIAYNLLTLSYSVKKDFFFV